MTDEQMARAQAKSEELLASLRAAPTAAGIDAAVMVGWNLGRVSLLDAISSIQPEDVLGTDPQGRVWIKAIPLSELRKVIEDEQRLVAHQQRLYGEGLL